MGANSVKMYQIPAYANSKTNMTAGTILIKATPGRVGKLFINTAGTAGAWAIYDVAAASATAAANLVTSIAYGAASVAAGLSVDISYPCQNGIVVVVPTTGVAALTWQ